MMNSEFPGVVDLNVSGTHYRTLLSTLTKDEDSKLAAMFTGRLPVHKDKDERYFIEAEGETFKAVLHYLQYDELPLQERSTHGFGRGTSGFGSAGGLFSDHQAGYSSRQIELLYMDSQNLGLKGLTQALEQFQPNFSKSRMDNYRKSIRGYDETLATILELIPVETLFHKTDFTVRIKQVMHSPEVENCCEHECKILPINAFQQSFQPAIDGVVKVPFEVNPTVLSALNIDLQKRGYTVQGQMSVCYFECKKDIKQSKLIVFSGQRKNCCAEELYLLTFRWGTEANVVTHAGPFANKQPVFGQPEQGTLFGGPQKTGFSFGSSPSKQTGPGLFGGVAHGNVGENQTNAFGATTQPGITTQGSSFSFGSAWVGAGQQPGPSAQGSSFGTGQQQQSLFGQQQQQQQQGGGIFSSPESNKNIFGGGIQTSLIGTPNKAFGQAQKSSPGSFSFGSPPKQSSAFSGKGSSFGVQKNAQPLFTSPKKAQHTFGGQPSFENKFGSTSPHQATVTVKPDQTSGAATSGTATSGTADDKSNMIFGKPVATAGVFKTEDNDSQSQ